MYFTKEHLKGDHYIWNDMELQLQATEQPRRVSFNPRSGDQLLMLINYFSQSIGCISLDEAQHIEELIRSQKPEDFKSEQSVFNWLRGRYLYVKHSVR